MCFLYCSSHSCMPSLSHLHESLLSCNISNVNIKVILCCWCYARCMPFVSTSLFHWFNFLKLTFFEIHRLDCNFLSHETLFFLCFAEHSHWFRKIELHFLLVVSIFSRCTWTLLRVKSKLDLLWGCREGMELIWLNWAFLFVAGRTSKSSSIKWNTFWNSIMLIISFSLSSSRRLVDCWWLEKCFIFSRRNFTELTHSWCLLCLLVLIDFISISLDVAVPSPSIFVHTKVASRKLQQ